MNHRGTGDHSDAGPREMRAALPAVLAAALSVVAFAGGALAAESVAQTSPRATVSLISDADAVAPGQTFRIGLRQKLAPHWHTYWKNPGDAGAPPDITLKLPDGATAGEISWPGPDGIPVGPVRNFGYEKEIVLPITVTVPRTAAAGGTFSIVADANWLVCEKECIPESGSFRLDLPVSSTPAAAGGEVAAAFAATDTRMPVASPWTAQLAVEGPALALSVAGAGISGASVKDAFFYPEEWGVVVHAAAQQLSVEEGRLRLAMEKGLSFNPDGNHGGLLAVTDGGGRTRWFQMAPTIEAAPVPADAAAARAGSLDMLPLWQTALFAVLGGLILNLMPCVFPVLAIKATAVARLSGGALRAVRLAGLFYTLGVLSAFVALAGLLLALRAAGGAVGWGFQFQSPLFVAAMSWLMLAIGLNLSGVYEIGLSIIGAGQELAHGPGHAGSFFTGLLAVVVATPCTAPFMGVAIGTALAASPGVCLALFAAMGLGLAAPYALLGIFPRLARLLPRPGAWMVRLRQAMAFPMYASAAWLVWVLTRQAGDFGVMIALSGGLLVALAAWAFGIAQHGSGRGWVARGLAVASVVAVAALLPQLRGVPVPGAAATASGAEPFSGARLAALRQEGRPVFVNMTAAWCITCLVNERTTLSTAAVKAAFDTHDVTYLKGDWTNQDPEITAFLRGFNRDGLPFYAFYPAGGREPVVLPPVLTAAAVVNEVRRTMAN
ncbi:protein-disulfide reductase DsbD family protein [Xanthobacter sediminis]